MIGSRVFRFLPILVILTGAFFRAGGTGAGADDDSIQPYIDHLKERMKPSSEPSPTPDLPDPFIQSLKRKMRPEQERNSENPEPYIDSLKRKHPERYGPLPESSQNVEPYIESQKAKLGPGNETSAIEAVQNGTSALKMKRPGAITGAFGFRVGTIVSHDATASGGAQSASFSSLYGQNYAPDFSLLGEYQFFHSEKWGSLGAVFTVGLSYFHGFGNYQFQLKQPDGTPFPMTSQTQFQFFAIPVSAGLDYRFNLTNYIRPFAMLSPTGIAFFESRSDNLAGGNHHGLSKGFQTAIGTAILADFISRNTAWDLYTDYGIKHAYFTVEYDRLMSVASTVNFTFSGLDVGVLFEF